MFHDQQAALLMKSQVQAIGHEDLEIPADMDIAELIGQSISAERLVLFLYKFPVLLYIM